MWLLAGMLIHYFTNRAGTAAAAQGFLAGLFFSKFQAFSALLNRSQNPA
jgi:hypothetical protein